MTSGARFGFAVAVAIAMGASGLVWAQTPKDGSWAPFQFLIGTWSGSGSGQPGEASSGSTTFTFELDKNVIVRKNRAEYPPPPGKNTAIVHEDLLIIFRPKGDAQFRAIYFDNEGNVIHYAVSLPGLGKPTVVFESEGNGTTSRFKLVYEAADKDSMSVEFFVAPPGGELKSYVKGTVERKM